MAKVTAVGVWCPRCGQTKTAADFHRKGTNGFQAYCRSCFKELGAARYLADKDRILEQSRQWSRENRDKVNAARRKRRADPVYRARELARDRERDRLRHPDRWIREHYNLTREQWNALLAAQGGGCAICGTTVPKGIGRFHVDHDHACCPGKKSCGKCVRGLLCNRCNPLLGYVNDDPALLRKAAAYLEVHHLR